MQLRKETYFEAVDVVTLIAFVTPLKFNQYRIVICFNLKIAKF